MDATLILKWVESTQPLPDGGDAARLKRGDIVTVAVPRRNGPLPTSSTHALLHVTGVPDRAKRQLKGVLAIPDITAPGGAGEQTLLRAAKWGIPVANLSAPEFAALDTARELEITAARLLQICEIRRTGVKLRLADL